MEMLARRPMINREPNYRKLQVIIIIVISTWVFTFSIINKEYVLTEPHPALNGECYSGDRLLENSEEPAVENTCCSLHKYTSADVLNCIERASERSWKAKDSPGRQRPTSKLHPPATWAVVGGVQASQLFASLVAKTYGVAPRHKLNRQDYFWVEPGDLLFNLRTGDVHEDVEIRHENLPLKIFFHWDPYLTRLPYLAKEWLLQKQDTPSFLLIETGHQWLKDSLDVHRRNRKDATSPDFSSRIRALTTLLRILNEHIQVFVQLNNHVQERGIKYSHEDVYSNEEVDQYNSVLVESLRSTGSVLWDSNVSFSDEYFRLCRVLNRTTPDATWSCQDPLSVGFIIVDVFSDMILNDVCNPFMPVSKDAC